MFFNSLICEMQLVFTIVTSGFLPNYYDQWISQSIEKTKENLKIYRREKS